MKIFAPATAAWFRTIKRPPHCLVLVILPLLASGPVAVAQPDRAAISLPAKESDSDAQSPESPTYVKRFDRTYFRDRSASHYYLFNPLPPSNLTPAFYPPVPPALGAELTLLPPLTAGFPAPAELAEFISDWFYPLLASQLTGNGLSESLRAQLQSYRAKKTGLQNELRSHLARLKDWAPDRREKDLAAFAAEQSPRLAELENIAEEIRHDLRHNDLLGAPVGNDDWTTSAGPLPPNASAEDEKKIETALLRGAVFYQDGLSAAQRRLLLEEIISRENTIRPSSSGVSTRPQEWQLPFSPSPARIRLASSSCQKI